MRNIDGEDVHRFLGNQYLYLTDHVILCRSYRIEAAITDMETELKNPAEYLAALKEIEVLMSAERGTEEGMRLEALAKQVEAYEAKHFPMDHPK